MTMGLKLASAGDAKDDQKTQNVLENVAKTGRVSLFFCARGANYAQNQVARAERENSRAEVTRAESGRASRSEAVAIEHSCRTPPCVATLPPASDHALTLRHHPEGRYCGPLWRRKDER